MLKNMCCVITFWSHCLLTGRFFFSMRVQRAAGSCRDWLRESWISSLCGGDWGLGGRDVWLHRVEGRGLSILSLWFRQRRLLSQLHITWSYSTATTYSFITGPMTLRRTCWHWRELYPALGCVRGGPVWLERRLEHVNRKPAQRKKTVNELMYSYLSHLNVH